MIEPNEESEENPGRSGAYANAAKLRKRGLIGNITDNLIAGNNVRGSFRQGISDTFKAKMTGIKETFDPLNVAKKLTGNLGASIVGSLTGRSAQDLAYFAGQGLKKNELGKVGAVDTAFYTNVARGGARLRKGESLSDIASKLFFFLQKTNEEKKLHFELDHDFEKEKFEKEKRNHKELIEALKGGKEIPKKEEEKEEVLEKEKPKKPKVEVKEVEKPSTFSAIKETVVSKAETAVGAVRNVGQNIATTTTRAFETVKTVTPSASTAAKVAVGVTAAAAPTTLGDLIAKKGESGKAGYNAANMGTKGGKIQPVKQPVNLEQLTVGEVMERQAIKWGSKDEDKKLFAVGKYQIIPGTLKDAVTALGISKNAPFDAKTQEKIFNEYLLKVRKPSLQAYLVSKEDDPVLLKKAIHELSLEWASIADPNIPGGTTSHYGSGNKASIFVSEMEQTLRLEREKNNRTTAAPTPASNGVGTKLAATSVQYQDLTDKSAPNVVVLNNSVTSVSGGTVNKQIMAVPAKDIKPTYMAN